MMMARAPCVTWHESREEQPILCHGIGHPRLREHGPQETAVGKGPAEGMELWKEGFRLDLCGAAGPSLRLSPEGGGP